MKSLFSQKLDTPTAPIDLSRALKPPARIIPVVKMPERTSQDRTAPRKETWSVCGLYSERALIREGVIMDVSKTGARIRFRARGTLPRYLRIKSSRIGLNRMARVVWQDSYNAGLQFVVPPPKENPDPSGDNTANEKPKSDNQQPEPRSD